MAVAEFITLIKRTYIGGELLESSRNVLAEKGSIGYREYYEANANDFHPELKLVLADYLDYDGETLVAYNGQRYRVMRTYCLGQALELTVERAPVEDGDI